MNNKSCCSPVPPLRSTEMGQLRRLLCGAAMLLASSCLAFGGDAPSWMHSVVSAPLPDHDDKTDAVLLYSERTVNVQSLDKIKVHVRVVYKILRPSGREYGYA